MKSLLSVLPLLPLTLAATLAPGRLDPDVPIYLGEVFWPPTMTFIAWLPNEQNGPIDWCYKATDASNKALFSLNGVDALQIVDYFKDEAYITREGKRFADCVVTPESVKMGACTGVTDQECESGHRFTGPGKRKWSCWINDRELWGGNGTTKGEPQALGEGLTDALFTPAATIADVTAGDPTHAVFTAGVTA